MAERGGGFRVRLDRLKNGREQFKQRWDRAVLQGLMREAEELVRDVGRAMGIPGIDGADDEHALIHVLDARVPAGRRVAGPEGLPPYHGALREATNLLASFLRFRYRFDLDPADLHAAIRADRVGLRLVGTDAPGHPGRAWRVGSIAQTTYDLVRTREADDGLDTAIEELRAVVAADVGRAPAERGRRSTLAGLLRLKAARTGDPALVDEAIELHRNSLDQGTGRDPAYKPWQVQELAACFLLRDDLVRRDHPNRPSPYLRLARDAAAEAWRLREGDVSIGVLDTALVLGEALRRTEPDTLDLHAVLKRACQVLDRLERRRAFGDRRILLSLGSRYGTLRDWLVEWHVRAYGRAVARGDAAAAGRRLARAYAAIEGGKQRTLVAHMDVRDLRGTGEVRSDLDRLQGVAMQYPVGTDDDAVDGSMGREASRPDLTKEDRLGAKIAKAAPDVAAAWGLVSPAPLDAVAAALPPRTTMVVLYPLADETVVIGVPGGTGGSPALAVAPIGQGRLHPLVDHAFRDRARRRIGRPDPGALDGILGELGRALVPALAAVVPGWAEATAGPVRDDVPALVLVPTGPLHRLPMHALPLGTPHRGGGDRERLVDRYAVSYATTADILPRVVGRPAAADGVAALAPAACDSGTNGAVPHLTVAFAQALAARAAGAPARVRHEASRRTVAEEGVLGGNRLAFVAAHGRAGEARPASPAGTALGAVPGDWDDGGARAGLLMHCGQEGLDEGRWLTVRRIVSRIDLAHVDHLHLLACETHAEDPAPGDELSGLLSAFLVGGARSVGGTLWGVDEVPAILVGWWMAADLLAGDPDKAAALRRATRRLRRATHADLATALREVRACLPGTGRDAAGADGLDECIRHLDSLGRAAPGGATALWQLHHWSPYVLHGAPQMRGAGADA